MAFTYSQYVSARVYLIFKALVSDRNKPPTPAEVVLYEACFDFQKGKLIWTDGS